MLASARRVREVMQTGPSVPDRGEQGAVQSPLLLGLLCDRVSFSYPGAEFVLRDVSLRIGNSERVALIGKSGSGKSTLSRLLARMADPNSGYVLLEGRPVPEYTLSALRRTVGYVTQHQYCSREQFARISCTETRMRPIRKSTVQSRLPNFYLFSLGYHLAWRLCWGRKQWDCRAESVSGLLWHERCCCDRDLVLDESTSALDLPTDTTSFGHCQIPRRLALVVISHRLRSLTWVIGLFCCDSGGIVAQGYAPVPTKKSTLYRSLYEREETRRRSLYFSRTGHGAASQNPAETGQRFRVSEKNVASCEVVYLASQLAGERFIFSFCPGHLETKCQLVRWRRSGRGVL